MIGGTTVRKQSRRRKELRRKEGRERERERESFWTWSGRSLALACAFPSTEEVHFARPQLLNVKSTPRRETSFGNVVGLRFVYSGNNAITLIQYSECIVKNQPPHGWVSDSYF